MAIHWTIPFKSLRSGTIYTVNIYDSTFSGSPIPLTGGAQPFTTQESDDDNPFAPIRTQSGYLRIVDNGKDANGNSFNWKSILPSTDTDRPVTLTDGNGNVVWQGFMQAQNFGGTLYGNPQEREYPIQCALTVLEGTDINYTQKEIQNFAYLLNHIIGSIPTIDIDTVIVEGLYAEDYLLKKIDWQNFVSEDYDGNLSARYNLYECLEDMCRFWGWTARTYKKMLILTCADDMDGASFWSMTRAQLTTMAGGTQAGTRISNFTKVYLSGDIFASVSNDDFRQRGPNKATVKVDVNKADTDIISTKTDQFKKQTYAQGWASPTQDDDGKYRYTNDLLSISFPTMQATATSGKASFNMAHLWDGENASCVEVPLVRIKAAYNGTTFATFQTVYEHGFSENHLSIHCSAYQKYKKMETEIANGSRGDKTMIIHLGIGKTRATAKWLVTTGGTMSWGNSPSDVRITYNNNDGLAWVMEPGTTIGTTIADQIAVPSGYTGLVFIDLLGTTETQVTTFDLSDFYVSVEHGVDGYTVDGIIAEQYQTNTKEYKSTNGNNVRDEWNADCIYASDNGLPFGYGLLMNANGSYMKEIHSYNIPQYHEQWEADRVTEYWSTARRKITTELRSNVSISTTQSTQVTVGDISPMYLGILDSTTLHPISIGRDWRDDIVKLTLLEMPTS